MHCTLLLSWNKYSRLVCLGCIDTPVHVAISPDVENGHSLDKLLPMYLGLSSFNPLRVGTTDWHNVHYRCSRFLFRFTKAAFVLLVFFSIISALLQRHARHHTLSHTLATRPEHQYSLCKSAASGDVATGTSLSMHQTQPNLVHICYSLCRFQRYNWMQFTCYSYWVPDPGVDHPKIIY